MKIAIFTDTFYPMIDGVVTSTVNLATELSKLGNSILIVTAGEKYEKSSLSKNIEVIKYNGISLPSYKDYKITIPCGKVIKLVKEFKPDIIHIQTPFGIGWEGIIAGKYLKIPVVGTHHTFYSDYIKHLFFVDLKLLRKFNDKYTAFFFNRCKLVSSPSNALLGELKNVGVKREIERIPNGIIISRYNKKKDLKKSYGLKRSVMYFGRVSYEKSIDVVVKAMAIVQKKYPDVSLLIVGDGPNLNEIKELANKLRVKSVFTGFKRDQELIDSIYSGDVFATASKTENQPMSILEAMACGKSLVGVNAKGVPELIINNKNGFIAEPDNEKELAEKIIQILENPGIRKKFEKQSLKLVKEYSTKNVARKWLETYKRVIENKG